MKTKEIVLPDIPATVTPGTIRVLQSSDWHIGAEPSMLTDTRAQSRREELLRYVDELPKIARKFRVDVVLLPGDLFQNEDVSLKDVDHAIAALNAFAPIPVVIAAGNHDPFYLLSHYNKQLTAKRSNSTSVYGDHIYIASGEWQRFEFYEFAVTARSFVSQAKKTEPALTGVPRRGDSPIELLCIHGSLGTLPEGQDTVAPMTEGELFKLQYDYTAMGHFHRQSKHLRGDKIAAGYSGSLAVLRKNSGETGVTILDVEPGGVAPERCWQFSLDRCRVMKIVVEVNSDTSDLMNMIKESFATAGVTSDDYVRLTITGRAPLGRFQAPRLEDVAELCFGLDVDNQVQPDWDFDALMQGSTTEAVFVKNLRDRIRDAEQRGDAAAVKLLSDALDIGLQALKRNKIEYLPK
ncbi:MAG: metallophosphoesterase [bacterium]|nr:metallophosphoesterase [bacterium]